MMPFIIKPMQFIPRQRRWEECPADMAPTFAVIELTDGGERHVAYGATIAEATTLRDQIARGSKR